MAYPDDLLRDAFHLASLGGKRPRQSTQRRAVSTAYYALFHLLIADFVENWKLEDQRVRLGRMFTHKGMSSAKFQVHGRKESTVDKKLKEVIAAFCQLQQDRYIADYDFARNWSVTEVATSFGLADEAFVTWKEIRNEKVAQDHLLKMFGARE